MANVTIDNNIHIVKSPSALQDLCMKLVKMGLSDPSAMYTLFIWGKPGIGKSSVVKNVAKLLDIDVVDTRISQLAPTDLRGLPVPDSDQKVSEWYPPSFLPRDPNSRGILFLDEFNMAPPAMQSIAQQLILDRKVGDYVVPDGWFIWAAGNRKEDRAAVFDLPAPVANRMLHVCVEINTRAFLEHANEVFNLDERLAAFLYFTDHVHKFNPNTPVWPSPRTIEYANTLLKNELPISLAVGEPFENEFKGYCAVYRDPRFPDIDQVLEKGEKYKKELDFSEPSLIAAIIFALANRATTGPEAYKSIKWVSSNIDKKNGPKEYLTLLTQYYTSGKNDKIVEYLSTMISKDPVLKELYLKTVRSKELY